LILSRTSGISPQRLQETLEILRSLNPNAIIVTTPWDQLEGTDLLEAMQTNIKLEERIQNLIHDANDDHDHEHHHDHHHDEDHEDHEGHEDHEDHEHDHAHDYDHEHHHADHAHHHHADEVFDAWGEETPALYDRRKIEEILTKLDTGQYGNVLRAKGMLPTTDGSWIYFDYVPGESSLRDGKAQVTGKICVIGESLKTRDLQALFHYAP
jgi:G3E family GTPase